MIVLLSTHYLILPVINQDLTGMSIDFEVAGEN
jgi:hypothetical protein